MDIQITSRHFKARPSLVEYAEDSVRKLSQIYDGIINAQVILEAESHDDGKIAEIILMVYHDRLFAKEAGEDFEKCISSCVDKLERQLHKYKDKLKAKEGRDKSAVVPEEGVMSDDEEEL